METSIGNRIAQVRKNLSLTQQAFADKSGVNRAYLGNIEKGRKEASLGFVQAVCDSYGINSDWLLTGEGPIYRQQKWGVKEEPAEYTALSPQQKDLLETFNSLPEPEQEELIRLARKEKEQADIRKRLEKLERKTT